MDHNLDDQLTLESDMGVDYEVQSEDVNVKEEAMGMVGQMQNLEEHTIMMDTENEEIIVSDYISDQYMLEEMPIEDSDMTQVMHNEEVIESEEQDYTQESQDGMLDLKFEEPMSVPASGVLTSNPNSQLQFQRRIITLKPTTNSGVSPGVKTTGPRTIAIAPKPARLVHVQRTCASSKLQAIAPKLVASSQLSGVLNQQPGMQPRTISLVKKTSVLKGNTLGLSQLGKQLVVVPSASAGTGGGASGGGGVPRVRVLAPPGAELRLLPQGDQGKSQLTTASIQTSQSRVIQVQGATSPGGAVLTRIGRAAPSNTVFTMQQKTVPITFGNKVIMASPTKQGVRYSQKQQLITIKSPMKIAPATTAQDITTKKVLITANPSQSSLVLKASGKPNQSTKIATIPQKSQFHQINVPGKGIQYIRLVPNTTTTTTKASATPKTLVFTDSKGNLIQVATDKMNSGQPPPLVVTDSALSKCKLAPKPQQKIVRIASMSKTVPISTQMSQPARAGQSLLAPLRPAAPPQPVAPLTPLAPLKVEPEPQIQSHAETDFSMDGDLDKSEIEEDENDTHIKTIESKDALRALIEDTVSGEPSAGQELTVEYCPDQTEHHDQSDQPDRDDHQHEVILLPSSFTNREQEQEQEHDQEDKSISSEARRLSNMLNVEVDGYNLFQAATSSPTLEDSELVQSEIDGLRPRKACNCTKSQCLKLYCDCFANGEFCHRCNCNNCHNNLEHEELRQKAIRGCLDRNPNAFRPKIGKSKTGGPELIRRHNKGCNCKRSGCLKNYCECYEAKIACTSICKCVGCRNVEETLERGRRPQRDVARAQLTTHAPLKQPCRFMTDEVISAVCQCLVAAASEGGSDPVRGVLDEFARCLQDVIGAAQTKPRNTVPQPNA